MKKEAELTPQEKQERAWTQKRIHYHNVQAIWRDSMEGTGSERAGTENG